MNIFVTDFSASKRVRVFKFCSYLLSVEVSSVKENHNAEISFDFTFFPSIILSVMNKAKFVSNIFQELLNLGF